MEIIYTPQAVADLKYWKLTGNIAIQKKIQQLIIAIQENPFEGIGKPEPLNMIWLVLGPAELIGTPYCL